MLKSLRWKAVITFFLSGMRDGPITLLDFGILLCLCLLFPASLLFSEK